MDKIGEVWLSNEIGRGKMNIVKHCDFEPSLCMEIYTHCTNSELRRLDGAAIIVNVRLEPG